jgi:putative oxidoreductase
MNVAATTSTGSSSWTEWLWLALRLAIAGLFAYAGATKIGDPTAFAVEIDHYQLLPWLAPYMAAALPALELTLAVALVFFPAPWRRAAALGCLALMVAFTVAAGSALARKLDIDCGCFGKGSGPITWLTIARDVALVAACAVLVRKA